jgi:hypothetical protein
MLKIAASIVAASLLILPGLTSHAVAASPKEGASACTSLTMAALRHPDSTAKIETATWHAGVTSLKVSMGPVQTATVEVPSHCEIIGRLQQRSGANNQTYAIRFHLRLPAQWNNRFFFQGGGGSNGELGDALGQYASESPNAISQGYAVVSQDSGHDNATNTDEAFNGAVAFGFDPVARTNYGHASLKLVADAAKDLIKAYYGSPPRYSYFVGCSKGGQEGMTFAQLFPEEFDGIVAAAPGFSLPRAALAEAWDVQAFGALVTTPGQNLDFTQLQQAFRPSDLGLLRTSILKACDADDGLSDGIVGDIYGCTDAKVLTELQSVTCKEGQSAACLTPAQIAALRKVMQGPVNTAGRPLYSGWFWPSGVDGEAWRMWKIGSSDGRIPALNLILGGSSLASVFTTPPTPLPGGPQAIARYQMAFDFDRDAPAIYATSATFKTSAWQDIGSRSPDLKAFRAHGGRLIVPHGDSDPVFSLKDTLAWFDEVNTAEKGHASDFVRVFPVPGMCHCGGGQATDQFDAFSSLVKWVEKGAPPESLSATAGQGSPWPGRQRPICAYPKVARYKGAGNPELADSFQCRL